MRRKAGGAAGERCDVCVVGGGHNGLVCATLLARAGLAVVVVDAAEGPGGSLWSEDLRFGRVDRGAVEHTGLLGAALARELDLAGAGLEMVMRHAPGAHVFGDGSVIRFGPRPEDTAASIADLGGPDAQADADAWLALSEMSRLLAAAFSHADTLGASARALVAAARTAGRTRLTNSLADLADLTALDATTASARWFRHAAVRAAFVARSTYSALPPDAPGTAAVSAIARAGQSHGPFLRAVGGSRALAAALVRAARRAGAEVVTANPVTHLNRTGGGWLVRTDGRSFAADTVVAALPAPALPHLVDDALRPALQPLLTATTVVGNVSQATVATVLRHAPDLSALGPAAAGMVHLALSPASTAATAASARAGAVPERPAVLVTFPSLMDSTLLAADAPTGSTTLWANVFVGARLCRGHWAEHRHQLGDAVLDTLTTVLPGCGDPLDDVIVTTPEDLRRRTAAENPGNHLAPTLDQLLSHRPALGLHRYRTPLPGLYLSGAGTRPGGGVTGEPGRRAAAAVLADRCRPGSLRALRCASSARRWLEAAGGLALVGVRAARSTGRLPAPPPIADATHSALDSPA